MAMQDEIRELTVNLLQSTVNASLVTAVCVGTEQFLTRRLRRELTPADCHDVFVLAAALACLPESHGKRGAGAVPGGHNAAGLRPVKRPALCGGS